MYAWFIFELVIEWFCFRLSIYFLIFVSLAAACLFFLFLAGATSLTGAFNTPGNEHLWHMAEQQPPFLLPPHMFQQRPPPLMPQQRPLSHMAQRCAPRWAHRRVLQPPRMFPRPSFRASNEQSNNKKRKRQQHTNGTNFEKLQVAPLLHSQTEHTCAYRRSARPCRTEKKETKREESLNERISEPTCVDEII